MQYVVMKYIYMYMYIHGFCRSKRQLSVECLPTQLMLVGHGTYNFFVFLEIYMYLVLSNKSGVSGVARVHMAVHKGSSIQQTQPLAG